jgi:NAD(P)-dependent dehydrogenase (short-subunit alcohol dehydrogenase family)
MPELEGKTALITGGTTGLGRAMAERFLDEGASVVITGRDAELGAEAESALASRGLIRFLRADAGEPEQARASVDETGTLLGGLDILVNNAGIGVQAGLLDTPLDAYDRVMDVNVRGAFVYAQAAFPHLEARRGVMLHVASDAGVLGEEDIGIYSVSKAALIMLSNMYAIEGGRRGVRSNAICPGDTAPGMRHMGPPGQDRPEDDPATWIVPPLGRVGEAIDVADAAVFLCSERANFVNGVALLVDGGMRAGMRTGRDPGP